MRKTIIIAVTAAAVAGTAWAHNGVSDPTVKARMELMMTIKKATAVIGGMAKGKIEFDAQKATEAKAVLARAAARIDSAFEQPATDPLSEARPDIWQDRDGFAAKTDEFEAAATALDVTSLENLRAGLGDIGKSCGGCHKAYRVNK